METDLIFCDIKQETEHSALAVIIAVMCTWYYTQLLLPLP